MRSAGISTTSPGAFPVKAVEADPPPIDGDTRTLVTITESSWRPSPEGAKSAFGNCEGWTSMLAAMKVWLEHGINLREGYYK